MKSYIITLKGHELSERVSKECVTQAAKFNIDVTVFDAIWGKDYLERSVLDNPSPFMQQLYTLEDLLKVKENAIK